MALPCGSKKGEADIPTLPSFGMSLPVETSEPMRKRLAHVPKALRIAWLTSPLRPLWVSLSAAAKRDEELTHAVAQDALQAIVGIVLCVRYILQTYGFAVSWVRPLARRANPSSHRALTLGRRCNTRPRAQSLAAVCNIIIAVDVAVSLSMASARCGGCPRPRQSPGPA